MYIQVARFYFFSFLLHSPNVTTAPSLRPLVLLSSLSVRHRSFLSDVSACEVSPTIKLYIRIYIVACCLKGGISESEWPSIARQRLGKQVSSIIVWVTNAFSDNAYIDRHFLHNGGVIFVTTDKPNPSTRCSLLGWRKTILKRCRHR
jgi:hypothetical protein